MHDRIAQRIAREIHRRKWQLGWKPPTLAKWFEERFPKLSDEDRHQIISHVPRNVTMR